VGCYQSDASEQAARHLQRLYADFSNNSRPISMRRISLVPAPIS
jgi:hypothetical protein